MFSLLPMWVFQPFLRFYGRLCLAAESGVEIVKVSTLLEILQLTPKAREHFM